MAIGIYAITCIPNGCVYVGRTIEGFDIRWAGHLYELRKGAHYNRHLQRAWNKYGEDAFTFEILEECTVDAIAERESYHAQLVPRELLFNQDTIQPYVPCSNEKRAKVSAANRGKTLSREHRAKISDSVKRSLKSEETRAKISAARRGKPQPNISAAKKGKPWTEAQRAKIPAGQKEYHRRRREAKEAENG